MGSQVTLAHLPDDIQPLSLRIADDEPRLDSVPTAIRVVRRWINPWDHKSP